MTALTFDALRGDYARLWEDLEIRPSKAADIKATAKKIVGKKARYQAVEKAVGVPWYVVGLLHAMESSCNFATHLHNGDKLADGRTTRVPKNRPKAPPADGNAYTWKESACDALTMHGLDKIADWPIERICYELERYNGWGHRRYHEEVLTPYLWSYTNHYSRGKYVEDGKWSATAVSGQSGAMAILKECMALDADIRDELHLSDVPPVPAIQEIDPAAEFPKAEQKPIWQALKFSRVIFSGLTSAGALLAYIYHEAVEIALAAATQFDALAPLGKVLAALGISVAGVALVTAFAAIAGGIFSRLDDARKGATVK